MTHQDEKTLTKPVANLLAAETGRLSASLMVLTGQDIGKMFRIQKRETSLGRSSESDVQLDDESISRHHAKLVKSDEAVELIDLGSKNGTLLNGQRVTGRVTLRNGDKLQLGSVIVLKYSVQDMLDEAVQQMLYDSAIRDGLTGAFNRKFLTESLQKEFAFCQRHDVPISLLMMDVDYFKQVNDTLGHAAGDYALIKLVNSVHEAIRTEDVFARYGGEEFALILREVTEDVAVAVAERLRRRLEDEEIVFDGQRVKITISLGVATHVSGLFERAEDLVAAADRYLLMAKAEGRNRVQSKWLSGK